MSEAPEREVSEENNSLRSSQIQSMNKDKEEAQLISVDFEIYGRVQGVLFRKYAQDKGEKLGVRGWCKNSSSRGTVIGVLQGEPIQVERMKSWLEKTGSPHSTIVRAEFRNEQKIEDFSFLSFSSDS